MRVKICNKVTKNKVFKIKKNIKRKGTSEKKKEQKKSIFGGNKKSMRRRDNIEIM